MFPPVYRTLAAASAVTAIVGAHPALRCYRHGEAPQHEGGAGEPYLTWFIVGDDPALQLSGAPNHDRISVQIDAWSRNDLQAEQLAKAVRAALEPRASRVVVNGREPETRLYRIGQEVDWFVGRSA